MTTDASPSWLLAAYVSKLEFCDLPTAVVDCTKILLLDLLGVALAGGQTDEGEIALRACRAYGGGQGTSPLWGTGVVATEGLAAIHNGIVAHALELDDFNGADHSGAVVIPAVLAIAARYPNIPASRVLESIVVGYDVAKRILDGSGGYHEANAVGWHSTGPCGSIGAAVAAAKMLGLNTEQTSNALGLAGSFTGGTWAFLADGSMSKRYHAGRAAETGVMVAYLAQAGFTGPRHVLEAEWGGYFSLYAPKSTDLETVTANLGEDFRILHTGVKPYASCRGIHSAIDVILDLRQNHALRADYVERIDVNCGERQAIQLGKSDPSSRLAAQMSLPFSLAVALLQGHVTLEHYQEPWLSNQNVRALAGRIKMHGVGVTAGEPTLVVTTKSGDVIERQATNGRGAIENPMAPEEIVEKFTGLASRVYSKEDVGDIKKLVLSLEINGNLSALLKTIGNKPQSQAEEQQCEVA